MMASRIFKAAVVLTMAALAGSAAAVHFGTAWATYSGISPSSNINVSYMGGSYSGPGAGVYYMNVDTSNANTAWDDPLNPLLFNVNEGVKRFPGFCIELSQNTNGWATYDMVSPDVAPNPGVGVDPAAPMGNAKALFLSEFWHQYGPAAAEDWPAWLGNTTAYIEAFQVGIWEIVFEDPANGYDVTTGSMVVNSGLNYGAANLNAWLNDIATNDYDISSLIAFTHEDYQDWITVLPDELVPPIPEPLTLLGLCLGASGLGGYLRRR